MRIYGWSNAAGGVHHYRIREPLRGLALRGHETKSLPVATTEVFEQWDVVIVRGLHHPHNSMLWRWAASTGQPALRVYDLDDDIWGWKPGSKEDEYWNDERRLSAELNIQMADLVTTPTDSLAEVLRQLNPNVAVLPNTIPESLLRWHPAKHGPFIVGWQGAAQHVADLQLIYGPLLRFMLRHSDVQFHAWGPEKIADFPDALQERMICYPWVQSVWAHYSRLDMDIGLAPIDLGDRFNETKSDIRLREYSALGIPFIASRAPAYTPTALSVRAMVADSEQEWEDALNELYRNPNLRAWMSEQGRLRARLWTTENNGLEWERAYVRARDARDAGKAAVAADFSPSAISYNGNGDRAVANVVTNRT